MPDTPPVTRRDLLTARLDAPWPVTTVEIQEITLGPRQAVPLHLHPCPVVGVVTEGLIAYQVEGREVRLLPAGAAFYEPAGARVARFDNVGDVPARFVAHYLLAEDGGERIRILAP
jgi:quercetin dioxygenase-like cupin family protein